MRPKPVGPRERRKAKPQGTEFITDEQCADLPGVDKATWRRWVATRPGAPQPIRLSGNCTRWDRAEVLAWLRSLDRGVDSARGDRFGHEAKASSAGA